MVVLRGNNLEINQGFLFLFFLSNLNLNHLQMENVTLIQKRGNIPTQINSHNLKPLFSHFGETLQFEVVVPQLHTFHLNLHPPTHVQLEIPIVDV